MYPPTLERLGCRSWVRLTLLGGITCLGALLAVAARGRAAVMFKARNNLAVAYRLWPTPQALGSLRQVEMARRRMRTPG